MTTECPITFEPIPDEYLCSIGSQYFDLRALSQYLGMTKHPINPMTGEILEQEVIDSIMVYGKIEILLFDTRKTRPGIEIVDHLQPIPLAKSLNRYADTVLDLAWLFIQLGPAIEPTFCFSPTGEPIAIHLADYNLSLDQFFSEPVLEHDGKKVICVGFPEELPVVKKRRAEILFLKTLTASSGRYRKMIPKLFLGPPPPQEPTNDCLEMIKNVLACGEESAKEFSEIFRDARITADEFRALYHFINQIGVHYDFHHVLIAKVVDKWNFGSPDGKPFEIQDLEPLQRLEETYYMSRYQKPSFKVTINLDSRM